jgi:hypothetical protein
LVQESGTPPDQLSNDELRGRFVPEVADTVWDIMLNDRSAISEVTNIIDSNMLPKRLFLTFLPPFLFPVGVASRAKP